jgi:DNA-binding transcriptional MerR regulator
MSRSSSETHEQTYGIGAVAKLTGLSDHTIRVWERRYQAVVAQRSPNGRRVYTTSDVEKLNLLKLLTDRGLSIGRIAGESRDELKQRVESIAELTPTPAPSRIDVAILGDFLPAKIHAHEGDISPVNFVVADTSAERFAADIAQHPVDMLILEVPIVDEETVKRLRDLMTSSGARRAAFVYSFARTQDIERLRDAGTVLLRAPVGIDELRAAIVGAYEVPSVSGAPKRTQTRAVVDEDWAMDAVVEPRRFSQEQLAALANASSAIECECPHHLAELVADLTAFEIYSATCANRNNEDAALHRYLHQTTAQARVLIERALERVAEAEGLSY